MQNDASFLAMPEHRCMITRLIDEMRDAWREFRVDPRLFVKGAITANAGGGRRKTLLQVGLAIAMLAYAIAFITMLVFWSIAHQQAPPNQRADSERVVISLPRYRPKVDMPEGAGQPGGGGGRRTLTPPSIGALPIPSLTEMVITPRPESAFTLPALPILEKVMVDPRIQFKQDDLALTGLPDGSSLTPSAGPGAEGGIGAGARGGIGSGEGPGVGPGSGGNIGGGVLKIGVGRPYHAVTQPIVDERPILLNKPHPLFTEEARKNRVQGVVRLRILVDSSGAVKEVVVLRGLPDGLNEQAIRAAYQMRFKPALNDGQPVSYWMSNVEVEFNMR